MKETKIQLVGQEIAIREALAWQALKLSCENDLRAFFREAWPQFDSSRFVNTWHLDAIAEHLEAVSRGRIKRLLINIPPRHGKPVNQNSLVMCRGRGLVPLEEIVVGDDVWTHRGRWRRVLEVFEQGELDVLRITTRTGRFLEAAPDHPILTPDGWVETKDLQPDDVVGIVPGDGTGGMPAITPTEARLLGYIVGDGNISQGTTNITTDDDLVTADIIACAETLGFTGHEQRYALSKEGKFLRRVSLRGGFGFEPGCTKKGAIGPVQRWLVKHGLRGCNSYTKTIPQAVMRGPADAVRAFLGAYWACDGWICTKGAKRSGVARDDLEISVASVNETLIVQLQQLLTRMGMRSRIGKRVVNRKTKRQGDTYTSYVLTLIDQDNCWRFCQQIKLEHRKYDRITAARRRRFDFDHVVEGEVLASIEPAGKAHCRCLTVEEDSSFVAGGIAVHNTNLVSIAWPVWTWVHPPDDRYPLLGPGVRFLCASYGANKAEADGVTARRLIGSEWFKERWGDRVQIAKDRDNQSQYDTIVGGSRISTGIPESLGKGGAIRLVDDPHKTDEVESDIVRAATVRSYDEVWRTRSNDPVNGAEVMIMQRLADGDLSGHLLSENDPALVHLMLPMEFDSRRRCHTVLGFEDPRQKDGELLWPERFDKEWVANQKRRMGPYAWAGQFQQTPTLRGGGIILRDWWRVWPPEGQEDTWTREFHREGRMVRRLVFPDLEYVLLSCDTAYTEKEENDFSACIAWGVFRDEAKNPRIIMLEAWHERLELRALVHKIIATARRRTADAVLIEAKASGLSVLQEMRRLMRDGEFTLMSDVPKGDKLARLHAVSPAFSAGVVFAPDRAWAELVIEEVASFPRSRFKDLTDCVSSGIKKLRDLGLLQHTNEVQDEREEELITSSDGRASPREEYGL